LGSSTVGQLDAMVGVTNAIHAPAKIKLKPPIRAYQFFLNVIITLLYSAEFYILCKP
jgi:hypothetical protein